MEYCQLCSVKQLTLHTHVRFIRTWFQVQIEQQHSLFTTWEKVWSVYQIEKKTNRKMATSRLVVEAASTFFFLFSRHLQLMQPRRELSHLEQRKTKSDWSDRPVLHALHARIVSSQSTNCKTWKYKKHLHKLVFCLLLKVWFD